MKTLRMLLCFCVLAAAIAGASYAQCADGSSCEYCKYHLFLGVICTPASPGHDGYCYCYDMSGCITDNTSCQLGGPRLPGASAAGSHAQARIVSPGPLPWEAAASAACVDAASWNRSTALR